MCERCQADRPDHTERPAECGAVRAGCQQDVRCEHHETGDRYAAMPDRCTVDPVEPLLHPRQRADQDETDRQQQNRLRAQKLSDVAPDRLP